LIADALVSKINLSGKGNDVVASGVSFTIDGKAFTVTAKKEVILSAGVFGSPQILELSGIGSATLLKTHDVEVIIDNDNVGENLQDHALVPYSAEVANGELTMESFQDPELIGKAFKEYAQNRTGLLATPSINSSAFIPYTAVLSPVERSQAVSELDSILPNASAERLRPGLAKQYELIRDGLLSKDETSMQLLFLLAGIPEKNNQSQNSGKYITIGSCLQHPFSRGTVHSL
jgi:choline dehydrogenase-like flavoprotein